MPTKPKYKIFYSWQSDLPTTSNNRFISHRLTEACHEVESTQTDFLFYVDEATREAPGSPNIPTTIMDKIKTSDIFVCDISTINSSDSTTRKTPNPNVVFELGFAVATLGWNRIILLFNSEYGVFPADLPFDFDRHRASKYAATESPTKQHKSDLRSLLSHSVASIFSANPAKPQDSHSPDQIKRLRDVIQIKDLLTTLHLPTIENYINQLPKSIAEDIFFHWEDFNGKIDNQLFHIYDTTLQKIIYKFHKNFDQTLNHGQFYNATGYRNTFTTSMNAPLSPEQAKAWKIIEKSARLMKKYLNELLAYVRDNFVEIDILETNKIAMQRQIDFKK